MASEEVWWFVGLKVENVGSVVAFIALEPGRQVGSPENPSMVERTVGMWVCGYAEVGILMEGWLVQRCWDILYLKKQGLHIANMHSARVMETLAARLCTSTSLCRTLNAKATA